MCNLPDRSQWALTIVRIMLGIIFIAHGGQKALGLFGGPGLEKFAQWAAGYGIPTFLAYIAAWAEFIGGIMLLFGILPQLGALMTIGVMLGAVFIIHAGKGFFGQTGGFEYPLSLIIFAIAIIIGGPGKLALWNPCLCCKR